MEINQKKDSELVSCLCISRNTPNLLQQSTNCFRAQTYPEKEMIIIRYKCDHATKELLSSNTDENILDFEVDDENETILGELRNFSIEKSNGKYVCVWDGDDWFHEQRLEIQVGFLRRAAKSVCVLTNLLVFDALNRKAYYSYIYLWENTMLCKKAIFKDEIRYPKAKQRRRQPTIQAFDSPKLNLSAGLYPFIYLCLSWYEYVRGSAFHYYKSQQPGVVGSYRPDDRRYFE